MGQILYIYIYIYKICPIVVGACTKTVFKSSQPHITHVCIYVCIYIYIYIYIPEVERVQKYSTQVKVPLHY